MNLPTPTQVQELFRQRRRSEILQAKTDTLMEETLMLTELFTVDDCEEHKDEAFKRIKIISELMKSINEEMKELHIKIQIFKNDLK